MGEQSFPMCTLRSFPNKIEHTIAWARELFESSFVKPAETVNLYLGQPNYIETTLKQGGNEKATLEQIRDFLVEDKPLSVEDCIKWARLLFEKQYNNAILQLLYNFPKDSVSSSGQPFWSGPKRAPDPLKFDPKNEFHFTFVVAGANLHAYNYGINTKDLDEAMILKVLDNMIIPDFSPNASVKIQADDSEPDPNANSSAFDDNAELEKIVEKLPSPKQLAGFKLDPVEFEKDDDTNLALPFFGFSEPVESPKAKYKSHNGDVAIDKIWDRFEVDNVTLKEPLEYFEQKGLTVTMLSSGVSLLYASFFPPSKLADRYAMKLSDLVAHISKKPVPED